MWQSSYNYIVHQASFKKSLITKDTKGHKGLPSCPFVSLVVNDSLGLV